MLSAMTYPLCLQACVPGCHSVIMNLWGFGNLHSDGRCVGDSPGSLDFHWLSLHGFAHIIFLLSLDTTCSLLAGVVKSGLLGCGEIISVEIEDF